jgi:hypothetical protein
MKQINSKESQQKLNYVCQITSLKNLQIMGYNKYIIAERTATQWDQSNNWQQMIEHYSSI